MMAIINSITKIFMEVMTLAYTALLTPPLRMATYYQLLRRRN